MRPGSHVEILGSEDCFAPVPTAKHMIDCPGYSMRNGLAIVPGNCSQSNCVSILGSDPFSDFFHLKVTLARRALQKFEEEHCAWQNTEPVGVAQNRQSPSPGNAPVNASRRRQLI